MKKFTLNYILLLSIITLLTGCRTLCPPGDYYIKKFRYNTNEFNKIQEPVQFVNDSLP